ncbi:hypothetical protein CGCF415_v011882 [Colletotrichum fructicola]|nr:hypothetical protein CGCF415_v011882 [Colletotrichum fructicola]
MFQDVPHLFKGDSRASALRGKIPIHSPGRSLDPSGNGNLIVVRLYECESFHKDVEDHFTRNSPPCLDPPIPEDLWPYFDVLNEDTQPAKSTGDEIHISKQLRRTMEALADAESNTLRDWEKELRPPYVQIYYTRSFIRSRLHKEHDRDQGRHAIQLVNYVEDTFGQSYAEAEILFSQGLVKKTHMNMLFRPGDIVSNPRYMIDMEMYKNLHSDDEKHEDSPKSIRTLAFEIMCRDEPPSDSFLLLLPPTVPGFGMHDKKWRILQVEHISAIEWNKNAFEQLVLDYNHRELIEAVIRGHMSSNMSPDIVEGKGKGVIILLHGGPGTGKTLTAESVAELAEKPLYRVTCGDIGTDPEKVEKYLESVLFIGSAWQAVVLLDESDVFLEEREKMDLKRNALVSVFLRVLEYYEGILILTSNRAF